MKTREYAFDVKLFAVCRVTASSEALAREAMNDVLQACDVSEYFLDGYNDGRTDVVVTEFSINEDDSAPVLFEIDGDEVE